MKAEALEKLAKLGSIETLQKGEKPFCAGQKRHSLHFVVEGQARVTLLSEDGRERRLHLALPGDLVGAVAFFDQREYPCTLTAAEPSTFLAFNRDELSSLLASDSDVTLAILGGFVARQRKIVGLLEELSFENTSTRLWRYLLENSQSPDDEYPRVIESLPTREVIARGIGTVREVVSRRLSQLVKSGHIAIEGRRLTLRRPAD